MRDDHTEVKVDVQKIMEEIRAEIREKHVLDGIPSFEDIPIRSSQVQIPPQTAQETNYREHFMLNLDYLNHNVEVPYYWELGPSKAKKFIKRVIRKSVKFLLYPITQWQTQFNAHTVRCLNAVRDYIVDTSVQEQTNQALQNEIDSLKVIVEELKAQLDNSQTNVQELAQMNEQEIYGFRNQIESLTAELTEVKAITGALDAEVDVLVQVNNTNHEEFTNQIRAVFEALEQTKSMNGIFENRLNVMDQKLYAMDRASDDFSAQVAKVILQNQNITNGSACESAVSENVEKVSLNAADDVYSAIDYFAFQNAFRGTRRMIKDRQSMYVQYFTPNDAPVLDIGCGRGEFLQLMKEQNIPAFGIDLYPEYVIEGALHGLDVREGDGIAFLQNTELQFNGIIALQVIEHLNFEQIQILCRNAYEKMLAGTYLILETQNPMSVSMFTNTFYVDPSHQRPIHPLVMEYLLKEIGFSDVQILFTEDSAAEPLYPIKSDAIKNLDEVNRGIKRVSDMLFGSLDYAVIARK